MAFRGVDKVSAEISVQNCVGLFLRPLYLYAPAIGAEERGRRARGARAELAGRQGHTERSRVQSLLR